MGKVERAVIRHSVMDVIRVLENQPVRPDMIAELTVAQVMNRVSLAHLSIERAMKFIITEAQGPLIKDHDLPSRLNELRQHESESAKFLEEAFGEAVWHYRYNANAAHMKHLKSLETYLEATGSDKDFQDIRYWELTQSRNEIIVRQIYLTLHMELLHALKEILLPQKRPKDTISTRVERAVRDAMSPRRGLSYTEGTDKERSVKAYHQWLERFENFREAITQAFSEGVANGDEFISGIINKAFQQLVTSTDPAVKYFAETLTVLPKQPKDAIPCVEWMGSEKYQVGLVSTPGGDELGYIHRRSDGLWNVTPERDDSVQLSAITETQTDARCYLATLFSRRTRLVVVGEEKWLRIVGEEHFLFKRDYKQLAKWSQDMAGTAEPTFQVTFWDNTHGIMNGDMVRLETPSTSYPRAVDILEGTVIEVKDHEIFVQGSQYFGTES